MNKNIEENRGFFGIIIPAELLDSTELTVGDKFVYGFIASFTKACFLSNEAIAARIGVSEATVSRAISRLSRMSYVYVEFVNGNSAARRIYSVYDNPKKLRYLASKGMFNREEKKSFPQASQNDEGVRQFDEGVSQNDEGVRQNDYPHNGGEVRQFDDHRYRINKEESARACENVEKSHSQRPRRADFATQEEWEQAFYNYTEVVPCK